MASEIILTDPLRIPAIVFRIIRVVFEAIDNNATLTFLFQFFIITNPFKKPIKHNKTCETISVYYSPTGI